MQPDGVSGQPKDRRRRRGAVARGGWRARQAVIRWMNLVRGQLGLRRLPEGRTWDYVPATARRMEDDDDPEAFRRALPYGLSAVAFAVAVFLAFWVYGIVAGPPAAVETAGSRELVLQAMDLLRDGDTVGAGRLRERLRDMHGPDTAVFFLDGYLLAAEGGDAAARAERLGGRSWPGRRAARNLVTLAGYREATGDMDGALDALGRAAELRPADPGVRLLWAAALLTGGRPLEAIRESDELERLTGPNAAVFVIRGHARLAAGQPAAARRDFEAGLLYAATSPRMNLGLVDTLIRLGEYERAADQARRLLRHEPDNAQALTTLGIARERGGDIEGAHEAYLRAVEAAPDYVPALNNLAYLLVSARDAPAEALPHAKRAHELAPDAPQIADTLGWTYFRLGRRDEALPLLREAHAGLPEHPEVNLHLAQALLAEGSRDEAVTLLRRVADMGAQAAPFSDEARRRLEGLGGG